MHWSSKSACSSKEKIYSGNNKPFMSKTLSEAIIQVKE